MSDDMRMTGSVWPGELTLALSDILGTMCFEVIQIVRIYRALGFDIPKLAESEQAFFLHRALGFWFSHGDKWREAAQADLNALREAAAPALGAAEVAA